MKNNKLTKVDVWRFTVAFPTLLTFLPGLEERCSLFEDTTLPCWLCFRRFHNLTALHQHIAEHPTPLEVSNYFPRFCLKVSGFYRCSLCEKSKWWIFENKWFLERHIMNKHKLIRCEECCDSIIGLSAYRSHGHGVKLAPRAIFCSVCRRKFRNRRSLEAHVECHFKKIEMWGWKTSN